MQNSVHKTFSPSILMQKWSASSVPMLIVQVMLIISSSILFNKILRDPRCNRVLFVSNRAKSNMKIDNLPYQKSFWGTSFIITTWSLVAFVKIDFSFYSVYECLPDCIIIFSIDLLLLRRTDVIDWWQVAWIFQLFFCSFSYISSLFFLFLPFIY